MSGGLGQIALPAGQERIAHVPGVSMRDVEAKAEFSLTGVSGTGGVYSYLLLRRQSAGDYLRLGMYATSAGEVFLRGQAANGTTLFADVHTGLTFAANTGFLVRAQAAARARPRYA